MRVSESTGAVRPSPRDDFFRHANWEWFAENPLPDSEPEWGTFRILGDLTTRRLRDIAEEAQGADAPPFSPLEIVRDYYRSGMDLDVRNGAGLAPLRDLLDQIGSIEGGADLWRAVAALHLAGLDPFFGVGVREDAKRPGRNALMVRQGGLGMPDREYYLASDKEETRCSYRDFSARMFELAGMGPTEAGDAADASLRVEMALAEASAPMEVVRQVDKNYHAYRIARAKAQLPAIEWDAYFGALGIPGIRRMVVGQPAFLRRVAALAEKLPLDDIKAYLTLALLRGYADTLTEDFAGEHFTFYGKVLGGQREPRPLWKEVLTRDAWGILSNAFGPLYAERYFSAEDKERVVGMVARVCDAFAERVRAVTWMSERTKRLTLEKLAGITFKMGYPDEWIDLSGLEIGDVYAANALNAARFEVRRQLARAEEPYERTEWRMPPTLVNAMADYRREMTFPMAILQPPFFDRTADDASNYGAIGAVIGHELTHFFDDQGSKFDVSGAMKTWWDEADEKAFRAGAGDFVTHYGRYEVSGIAVNPNLTLGENIADVGGVSIALDALHRHRATDALPAEGDAQAAERRFFAAWARIWAQQIRHEELARRALIDPHAPGEVRTNATVSAIPRFYDVFGIREGDGMYVAPEDRPVLW